jgi:hypothetical protein
METEESPSKRRKTSPTTAIRIDATEGDAEIVNVEEVRQKTPQRASYMSPTKSSLSRFNPKLLPRPTSAGSGTSRPPSGETAFEEDARVANPFVPMKTLARDTVTELHAETPSRMATPEGESQGDVLAMRETDETSLRASPRRRRTSRQSSVGISGAPRRRSGIPGRLSSPLKTLPPIKSPPEPVIFPTIPIDNPTPRQPSPGSDEPGSAILAMDTQLQAELGAAATRQEETSPELPPTVDDGGILVLTNPAPLGLFSTPSKRPSRRRTQSGAPVAIRSPRGVERYIRPLKSKDLDNPTENELEGDRTSKDMNGKRAAKRRLVTQLSAQLKLLEEHASGIERQVAELNMSQDKVASMDKTKALSEKHMRRESRCAKSLNAFLPFSGQRKTGVKSSIFGTGPIPSHKPIVVKNALRYLTVFTSLTFSSKSSLIPPPLADQASAPMLLQHDIAIQSPSRLLVSTVSLHVNASSHKVAALSVLKLSPWAEPELRHFIRQRETNESVDHGDILGLCTGISSYLEAATRRAICWAQLEKEHQALLRSDIALSTTKFGSESELESGRAANDTRRRSMEATQASQTEDGDVIAGESILTRSQYTRRELLPHMGRQLLKFQRKVANSGVVSLLISWSIELDWIGEAKSILDASVALPPSCKYCVRLTRKT